MFLCNIGVCEEVEFGCCCSCFLVVSNETFGSHELYSSALLYKNKLNVVVCKQIVFFNIHI